MRDRLIELLIDTLSEWECEVHPETVSEIAEYLLENGIIAPPCKVGDTVYVHDNCIWFDDCCHCEHFQTGGFGDPHECARTKSPFKHPDCTEISETIATEKDILLWLACGDFGKTVFFTREEAEQALKGGVQE